MAASWLKDAVFYEIYPQSFYDTNGDGVGDLRGIIEKLDYVKSLGCNAVWLNPFYDSPFADAGYDVCDHKAVAARYGTLEDARELFRIAHEKGIRVLIDLVPGHTSETHPWFQESSKEHPCDEYAHRYIWTANAFCRGGEMPFISGESPRDGAYIINFFKCQPALNFGYRRIDESWQQPIDAPAPMATRAAIADIMLYWLEQGCDGFRVDMADSLVKNDGHEKIATMEVWKDITQRVRAKFPEAALVSEWNNPRQALNCGFDMDFMLDWYGNGYNCIARYYDLDEGGNIITDRSYFKKTSTADISGFLRDYLPQYEDTKDVGLRCLITGNHDTKRVSFNLDETERKLLFAFLLTMPGAPFIYYGDEIGMAYRWLPTKEGGYHRTGSRTPMQWDESENLGFTTGNDPYLPLDPNPGHATVAQQEKDPDSMLNFVRGLTALRKEHEDLGNYAPFSVYSAEEGSRLFAYKRGKLLLAVNPGTEELALPLDEAYEIVYAFGNANIAAGQMRLGSQSFAVLEPKAQ